MGRGELRWGRWMSDLFMLPEELIQVRFTCTACGTVYEAFAGYDDQATMLARLEHTHVMSAHFEDDEPDPDGGEEVPELVPMLKVVGG